MDRIGLGTDLFGAILGCLGAGDVVESGFSVVSGVCFVDIAFGDGVTGLRIGRATTDVDEIGGVIFIVGHLARSGGVVSGDGCEGIKWCHAYFLPSQDPFQGPALRRDRDFTGYDSGRGGRIARIVGRIGSRMPDSGSALRPGGSGENTNPPRCPLPEIVEIEEP
jgi:hypothetical protein